MLESSPREPIRFYFDFASPYGYFAAQEVDGIGAEFGRAVEWRPILLWAVLKAQGIAAPLDSPVRLAYLLNDMERSAAFLGMPYRRPAKFPLSSHLAGRLFYAIREREPGKASALARRMLCAFFAEGRDISDATTLSELAAEVAIAPETTAEAMQGSVGRAGLEAAVTEAVAAGVVGSPYFLVDGEGLFGADRLPQLRWFLGGRK